MRFAVIVFPGSNCDHEAQYTTETVLGQDVSMVWHKETSIGPADAVILPGGFSHGDYLRTGAIARFSPVMAAVKAFAEKGGPVLGICNGFQILQESGLLPGAMLRNSDLRFHCEFVHVRVEQNDTPFTRLCTPGQVLKVPISHGEGNFFAAPDVIADLEKNRRIVFRYVTASGDVTDAANPNGSLASIAGVCSAQRNVVGLMPHPERACDPRLGSDEGLILFRSVIDQFASTGAMQAV
jgi:phosphoribosylformylglycinamidine synthase